MNPPSGDAANVMSSFAATSMRLASASFVHTISAPRSTAMPLGFLRDRHRQRDPRARVALGHEHHEREQRLVGRDDVALVVDDRGPLAVGRDHVARARCPTPARATRSAPPVPSGSPTASGTVLANGFTASTSAPSFASTDGITIDAAPYE